MVKDKNIGKDKDIVLCVSDINYQYYDIVVDNLLNDNISRMIELVDSEKDVMMIYESFIGNSKIKYNGLDTVFKLEGLVEIFNKYFVRKRIDLVARKDAYNGYNTIRIYKFVRMKKGDGDGDGDRDRENGIISKTERKTVRDDIEIVDNSMSKDKEKIVKKIEEERKLIKEG